MCCRSPAAANQLPPPPTARGTCPAELENKLAIYGNNTKQLVSSFLAPFETGLIYSYDYYKANSFSFFFIPTAANSESEILLQEQQLGSMESEVRNMQMELANVQRERQQLEQQRKLLKCTGPCAPCSCCPPSQQQQQLVPQLKNMTPAMSITKVPVQLFDKNDYRSMKDYIDQMKSYENQNQNIDNSYEY